ncbi:hypothetical protein Psyaliredsea_19060 [Psychrobacter alimentarius]
MEPLLGNESSVTGIVRRSIQLGYIDYRERRVPIYLQRVRIEDSAPVWVFLSKQWAISTTFMSSITHQSLNAIYLNG